MILCFDKVTKSNNREREYFPKANRLAKWEVGQYILLLKTRYMLPVVILLKHKSGRWRPEEFFAPFL